jgi:hypothetical protein
MDSREMAIKGQQKKRQELGEEGYRKFMAEKGRKTYAKMTQEEINEKMRKVREGKNKLDKR